MPLVYPKLGNLVEFGPLMWGWGNNLLALSFGLQGLVVQPTNFVGHGSYPYLVCSPVTVIMAPCQRMMI